MLTPTKALPKKYSYSSINFQISLSTYKLDFQNKNYIYKIKNIDLFFWLGPLKKRKKKVLSHAQSACDEASYS